MSKNPIIELSSTELSLAPAIAITQLPTTEIPLNSDNYLNDLTKDIQININAGFRGSSITTVPAELLGSPYTSTE
jgi:hypothetical protein